jgi:hypothetical protein
MTVRHSSASIFVMCCPGTTIKPKKRLVMSTFTVADEDGAGFLSVEALIAVDVGGRYS